MAREGNIMAAHVACESAWTARAFEVQLYNNYEDDFFNNDSPLQSKAWWRDDISGCPFSFEKSVIAFLNFGFHPPSNSIFAERLHVVAKKAVKSCISKSRLTVFISYTRSYNAFIVPGNFLLPFAIGAVKVGFKYWLQGWLQVKLQIEAPSEELQQLQGGFRF